MKTVYKGSGIRVQDRRNEETARSGGRNAR
jgi:hypothetical protein